MKISDHPGQPNTTERDGRESVIKTAKYDFEPGVSDYSMLDNFRDITFMAYIYGLGLDVALNYGQGTGSAQMLRFVTEHTEVSCLAIIYKDRVTTNK